MVHRRHREVRPANLAPGEPEALKGLRRRDFVYEMEVYVEKRGAPRLFDDDMTLPNLLEHGFRLHEVTSVNLTKLLWKGTSLIVPVLAAWRKPSPPWARRLGRTRPKPNVREEAVTDHRVGSNDQIRPFPDEYLQFVRLFNAGKYWESHEVLEGPWRINRSPFYKGMIIYASAFVHAQRGNPRGVFKQLHKAKRYLNEYRPYYMGVDVNRILAHAAICIELVSVPDPPRGSSLVQAIPFDRISLETERVRGDEHEFSTFG